MRPPAREPATRALSFAICENAALSSRALCSAFLLVSFRDAGSQRLYILCREPVLLQALPRSWNTAAVALIVGSLGLAPPPAHRPVSSEPYLRRLGGMMDIPGGVAIKTRASRAHGETALAPRERPSRLGRLASGSRYPSCLVTIQ